MYRNTNFKQTWMLQYGVYFLERICRTETCYIYVYVICVCICIDGNIRLFLFNRLVTLTVGDKGTLGCRCSQ